MVLDYEKIVSPRELIERCLADDVLDDVCSWRKEIEGILDGVDKRKLVVVGPCSINDVDWALEYARKLKDLADRVRDKYFVVMRVYLEKPRSTVGWKGFVYDPDLDGSDQIDKGLKMGRKLMLDICRIGLPVATEFLEPAVSWYVGDLVSWGVVGARTSESQIHRQMASGLGMPVGFKNGTSGDLGVAIDAISSASKSHSYIGIDVDGCVSRVMSEGNKYSHLVLRGGRDAPNYFAEDVLKALNELRVAGLDERVVVDCSHANSRKDYRKQSDIFRDVVSQKNDKIVGLMLESNLNEGKQGLNDGKKGVSVTDGCIGFEETEKLLLSS